tara:strand:- start:145 stop:402 length:258 start_codon:yes stop_codon:yes gene_type:complete
MNPAKSIKGITHQTKTPPAKITSTRFMASSIDIMETNDIPVAVLKASFNSIWRDNMNVSSRMEVIKPFTMARLIIQMSGRGISEI